MRKIQAAWALGVAALVAGCSESAKQGEAGGAGRPEPASQIVVRVDKPGHAISPTLHGLMTEEINHAYDGGLYAELIQNRDFKQPVVPPQTGPRRTAQIPPAMTQPRPIPEVPLHWSALGYGRIDVDTKNPVNTTALTHSLRLRIAGGGGMAGIANEGYWGIPVMPNTEYKASFWARVQGRVGQMTVGIQSNDGKTMWASANVEGFGAEWKKYTVTLKTGDVKPSKDNRFVITMNGSGREAGDTVWFSLVSLFPPTYKDRPNGMRRDLMELLAGMKPTFLRFPGGNYLEGDYFNERFDWKKTIGPLEERPGHMCPWRYWSTDGLGLLEYLEWCEDLKMEPVLAVFAGYTLKGQGIATGPELEPYVQEALEEIEYVTGGSETPWGARRAKDGHRAPFKLRYVEVGNEDGFDRVPGRYNGRFTQFYDAIKKKYPELQVISTTSGRAAVTSRRPEVVDDHYYRPAVVMANDAGHYDRYDRNAPKVFVGEWASREGGRSRTITPTLWAALGDAAWMIGMERNSDVVVMHAYAPLLVNMNQGASQWPVDLIGYDCLSSFGSPSYWAQAMFANNVGTEVLPVEVKVPATRPAGATMPATMPSTGSGPATLKESLFATASRDEGSGDVIVKLVNMRSNAEEVVVVLEGVKGGKGWVETLAGEPGAVNSVEEPRRAAPVREQIQGGSRIVRRLPAYSVSVMRVKGK